MVNEHELNDERLIHVVGLDGLAAGLVVPYDGLREGDAQILDRHLVGLVAGGDAPQVSAQVLERLEVVAGQVVEEASEAEQARLVVVDLGGEDELGVVVRGGEGVGQLVEEALEEGDDGVRVVPVVVGDVDVEDAAVELGAQCGHHLSYARELIGITKGLQTYRL